jgi:RNA polymerase sigma-70 factor (ECF subfamily)
VTDLVAPDVARDDPLAVFERHRIELTGYCYRMLGSGFDADEAVQETMVRAWQGHARFEGRSSMRAWFYRIATNVCLDLLDGRRRRALPMGLGPASTGELGVELPESTWLQPVPDDRVLATGADPAEIAVARSSVRLAFVAALQHLPPRQRAVLILRDVLGWPALDVAALLDTSGTAVHSILARARVTLAHSGVALDAGGSALDDDQRVLLERYVDAFERYDVDSLVALLREDATLSMPPLAFWLHGREAIGRWWRREGAACGGSRLVPVRANGMAAFASYRPTPPGGYEAFAIQVIDVDGGRLAGIHTFIDRGLFPRFGLPDRLS